jgi:hypothetical protein
MKHEHIDLSSLQLAMLKSHRIHPLRPLDNHLSLLHALPSPNQNNTSHLPKDNLLLANLTITLYHQQQQKSTCTPCWTHNPYETNQNATDHL